jgi:hypothetical protein
MFNEAYKVTKLTADGLVKTGESVIHTITFTCDDAAPTAGSIKVFDNTSAAGTEVYEETFTTTPFRGYSVTLDCAVANGIYVDFTTTADVNCIVTYR